MHKGRSNGWRDVASDASLVWKTCSYTADCALKGQCMRLYQGTSFTNETKIPCPYIYLYLGITRSCIYSPFFIFFIFIVFFILITITSLPIAENPCFLLSALCRLALLVAPPPLPKLSPSKALHASCYSTASLNFSKLPSDLTAKLGQVCHTSQKKQSAPPPHHFFQGRMDSRRFVTFCQVAWQIPFPHVPATRFCDTYKYVDRISSDSES
ncbi:hypothetical protein V8C26DRAFT_401385 [Trichoderma gracile]